MWKKLSCLGLLNTKIQEKLLHSLLSVTSPDYVNEKKCTKNYVYSTGLYCVAVAQLSAAQKIKNRCSVILEPSLNIIEEFHRTSD